MFKKPVTWAVIFWGCYFGALGIASMAYYSPEQFHNVEPTQEEYEVYGGCKSMKSNKYKGDDAAAYCVREYMGELS